MSKNICSVCGSNFEYEAGRWKCPACGVYKEEEFSNEENTLLYNADQKLRLANFDDAELAFDDIVRKYPKNPAGYWGRLCSSYGVKEEVDFDGKKIPTCYATSIESVLDSKDYKKAISLANKDTKEYYQKQAEYIERVRKEWVEKASKEKPYEIFISYKDSDLENNIERTKDSVEAQDLYIHLTEQGYKVFFSRESLRDKVGEKYEPYIFNALSTAKVMIVYGCSPDYITSTWVKNEWSRYLKRIARGEKKSNSLLVACDGFSPNELPKVLSTNQCLNAKSKNFYIDLDKAIKNIINEDSKDNSSLRNEKIDSEHKHEYKNKVKVVEATCKQGGYTIFACECGKEKKTEYTPKRKTHEFGEWEIVKDSTCTEVGIKKRVCSVCGNDEEEIIEAKGHTFSEWQDSLDNKGMKERICSVCGFVDIQSTMENKKVDENHNHDFKKIRVVAPTCIQGGYTEYACECGETKKTDYTPKRSEHDFSDWKIVKEATCEDNGKRRRVCTICGYSEEEVIKAQGHNFSDWQVTLNDHNMRERVCSVCGYTETQPTEEYKQLLDKKKELENKQKLAKKQELERKHNKRKNIIKNISLISISLISLVVAIVGLFVFKPTVHWTFSQVENISEIWPNIWRFALSLIFFGALVGVILSYHFSDTYTYLFLPKGLVTVFLIYYLLTFKNSSELYNYSIPFWVMSGVCIIISLVFDFKEIFKWGTDSDIQDKFFSDIRQISLVIFMLAFTHTFSFLSLTTVWCILIMPVLSLIFMIFVK